MKPVKVHCYTSRKWYSPSEFESLAGRKARKWRQSLHHQGKPLAMFSISGSLSSSQGDHSVMSASSQDVTGSRSTPVSGLVLQSAVSDNNHSSDRAVSVGTSCDLFIVDTVLSFVKAYRLKGDNNSLKIKVYERFSGASVSAAKKLLCDSCAQALRSLNVPYQQRRDSDK